MGVRWTCMKNTESSTHSKRLKNRLRIIELMMQTTLSQALLLSSLPLPLRPLTLRDHLRLLRKQLRHDLFDVPTS